MYKTKSVIIRKRMFRYFYWLKKAKILIKKIHFCGVKCKIWWWNVCKTYWCTTLWPDYLWPLYKSGFIFQGLNVSCETSVNCHMWLLSLCLCDFALCIKTCEFSRDSEIKSDPNTLTLCFLLSLFRKACICAHMWLAFVICIYIWEGDMKGGTLRGERKKELWWMFVRKQANWL